MEFIQRNKIWLLLTAAVAILAAALFWPEAKKFGELQKYYSLPLQQLLRIEYNGEMTFADTGKAKIEYHIVREENMLKPKEPLYRIEIQSITSGDLKGKLRIAELAGLKKFYASALVRTIIQDWSEPDYYFILKHEAERDAEYGFKDCPNKLTIHFKSAEKKFCVGKSSQNDTRRYLFDTEKNQVVISPDFTVRRLLNNIFAQREQSLHPFGSEGVDLIEFKGAPQFLTRWPLLQDKTGGNLKFRMLQKDEGKKKINVWHVENLLSIKPSHAAEFANLLNALRVNAPYAINAEKSETPFSVLAANTGLAADSQPAFTGFIGAKKTDKLDTSLTTYAFFPPQVRPKISPPYQFDKQLVRPLDTLVVSNYNAGLISADIYPRLNSILQKIEDDLLEAQKKGQEAKNKKEKQEGNLPLKKIMP